MGLGPRRPASLDLVFCVCVCVCVCVLGVKVFNAIHTKNLYLFYHQHLSRNYFIFFIFKIVVKYT